MNLQKYKASSERVLVEGNPTKVGSGRPSFKQEGIKYVTLANEVPIDTVQQLKMALAGVFFGKKQAEVVNEALLEYIKNHQ
jgi:hypothetical protein